MIVKQQWDTTIQSIQKSPFKPRLIYAVFAYITLIIGVYWLWTHFSKNSYQELLINSLIFGFVVYGIFDFTMGALFVDYPIHMVVIDILWGMFLCSSITSLLYYLRAKQFIAFG
jgi:uncharacterized membrane protein